MSSEREGEGAGKRSDERQRPVPAVSQASGTESDRGGRDARYLDEPAGAPARVEQDGAELGGLERVAGKEEVEHLGVQPAQGRHQRHQRTQQPQGETPGHRGSLEDPAKLFDGAKGPTSDAAVDHSPDHQEEPHIAKPSTQGAGIDEPDCVILDDPG